MRIVVSIVLAAVLFGVGCDENQVAAERDMAVKSIDAPTGDVAYRAEVTPMATVENKGDTAATFSVRMSLLSPTDGTPYYDSLLDETLDAGGEKQLTFAESEPLEAAGKWTASCSVAYEGDLDSTNNVLTLEFEVGAPKDAIELIPLDNEISGWNRDGAMRTAENETQLYELIDGEAVDYLNNGFVKCAFQMFLGDVSGSTVDLEVRAYDMADSTNSNAIYDVFERGQTPWTQGQAGSEARIEQSLFSCTVDFWDDKFYVWVTISDASEPALDIAKLFALNVAAAIHE